MGKRYDLFALHFIWRQGVIISPGENKICQLALGVLLPAESCVPSPRPPTLSLLCKKSFSFPWVKYPRSFPSPTVPPVVCTSPVTLNLGCIPPEGMPRAPSSASCRGSQGLAWERGRKYPTGKTKQINGEKNKKPTASLKPLLREKTQNQSSLSGCT